MTQIFSMKWKPQGEHAERLVSKALSDLIEQGKLSMNTPLNRDVVGAILGHRRGPFQIQATHLPEGVTEALRGALEGLCEASCSDPHGEARYTLKTAYRGCEARFTTDPKFATDGRPFPRLVTVHGNIYRDGSHSEVPFEEIALIGSVKPSLVEIVAPHHHWWIFSGSLPIPSRQWRDLDEVTTPHPSHETIMDQVRETANLRGVVVQRIGEAAFLTETIEELGLIIDEVVTSITGKRGQKPLLITTDIYGQKLIRGGSKL